MGASTVSPSRDSLRDVAGLFRGVGGVVRQRYLGYRQRAWETEQIGRRPLYLNIGASEAHIPGWVNADLFRSPRTRIVGMDATRRWPFPDGAASAINSEHFVEHVTLEGARAYFREAYRVLGPGGVIRTSTPDLSELAKSYLEGDGAILESHSVFYAVETMADVVNTIFYMHGHRNIYDFPRLAGLLSDAGFVGIERVPFGESAHPVLRGIDQHDNGVRNRLTLAVDAVRPV